MNESNLYFNSATPSKTVVKWMKMRECCQRNMHTSVSESENKSKEPVRGSMLSWKEMKPLNCPRAAELPHLVSQAGPQELLGTKTDFSDGSAWSFLKLQQEYHRKGKKLQSGVLAER